MILDVFYSVEMIPSEPLCPDGSIVALDIGVLLGLSGLDVDQPDPSVFRPMLYAFSSSALRPRGAAAP